VTYLDLGGRNIAGTGHYAVRNAYRTSYFYPEIGRLEDVGTTWGNYSVGGSRNIMHLNGGATIRDITDGTSNTMALCENPFKKNASVYGPYWNAWAYTSGSEPVGNINRKAGCGGGSNGCPHAWGAGSKHTGGMHIGLADGSVRFLSESTDRVLVSQLITIGAGEVINLP
jgi:prepilin-type processing-associated H-X9-DG protein